MVIGGEEEVEILLDFKGQSPNHFEVWKYIGST